jgi:serine kinase of HPr protein (carbohydrate metabolism regulator)
MISTVHAAAVAVGGRAIMLLGPAGAGKSELALLLMDRGAALISDDAVQLSVRGSTVHAAPPVGYSGVMMLRDLGRVSFDFVAAPTPLSITVLLDPVDAEPALLPRLGQFGPIEGLFVPQWTTQPRTPAAARKVLLALERWGL